MSLNNTYTKLDIEKYWQGKLTAQQMRAMELAALQDSFLADAIDGYKNIDSNASDKHLQEIEKKILQQHTRAITTSSKNDKLKYWQYAAAVILVIGIGYIAVLVNRNHTTPTIAENKTKTVVEKSNDTLVENSNTTDSKVAASNNKQEENITTNHSNIKDDNRFYANTQKANNTTTTTATNNVVQETVKDKLSNNNVASNQTQQPSVAQNTIVQPSTTTYNAVNSKKETLPDLQVETTTTLARKSIITTKQENTTSYFVPPNATTNLSQKDWNNFLQHINSNNAQVASYNNISNNSINTNNNTANKTIELEFEIDSVGKATNIVITRPCSDSTLNNKAIEIIKNSPRFTNTNYQNNNTTKTKIEIQF